MGSAQSHSTGLSSIRSAVRVVKEKHLAHPEADDLKSLEVAQEEVRGLRALVLQMYEVIKIENAQVLGQIGESYVSLLCVATNLCPREQLHSFNSGAHANNRFPARNYRLR